MVQNQRMTIGTLNMMNTIHEALKQRTMSCKDLSLELGYPERTCYNRIQDLIAEGVVRIADKDGHRLRYAATEKTVIPQMPTPVGFVHPGSIINQIGSLEQRKPSRLEIMVERWDYAFVTLFRNAQIAVDEGKFSEEKIADLQKYFQQLRAELEVRLRVVNYLLSSDQYWTLEGLQSFSSDAAWPNIRIERAWQNVLKWGAPSLEEKES